MSNKLSYNVVIVGCARNIRKHLLNTRQKLEMISSLFNSATIIIYENDSTDNTLNLLRIWEKEHFIQLITEKNIRGRRTEILAHGRNLLYKKAMTLNFDLLIVVDLDDIINGLTKEGILSCFKTDINWAAIGGNSINNYYDLWALRTYDDWMPFDCWYSYHIEKKDINYSVNNRFKNIPTSTPPIKVESCFNGICIYKRKYLDNCSYGNGKYPELNNKKIIEKCEHVEFNNCILKNGGEIYINPKMIVS